jgi:hypothetical protein
MEVYSLAYQRLRHRASKPDTALSLLLAIWRAHQPTTSI